MIKPICPNCGNTMVYTEFIIDEDEYSAWICDCNNYDSVADFINEARDMDSQNASLIITNVDCDNTLNGLCPPSIKHFDN